MNGVLVDWLRAQSGRARSPRRRSSPRRTRLGFLTQAGTQSSARESIRVDSGFVSRHDAAIAAAPTTASGPAGAMLAPPGREDQPRWVRRYSELADAIAARLTTFGSGAKSRPAPLLSLMANLTNFLSSNAFGAVVGAIT
jgi:hypothetical protein